jgi:uncharacterized membrane protein
MLFYLKLYLLTVPVFFAVDLLWLGVIARRFYHEQLGHLLAERVDWAAAIGFYLIYISGILLFAVAPGLAEDSLRRTALGGAAFGFFTYITYELTNRATLPSWPWKIVVVDTLWGVALCTIVAVSAHLIGQRIA